MKTLIAATDFSKASLNAVNYAADMAAVIQAKLVLLHVLHVQLVSDIPEYTMQVEEDVFEERNKKMELLKQQLEKRIGRRVPVSFKIIEGDINGSIESFADDKKPFALVMGSKGTNKLEDFIFGSVTLHTAKHSHYPVLIIPEKAKFTSVSAIAFASDLVLEPASAALKTLRQWLNAFDAQLSIINVSYNAAKKDEKEKEFSALKKHLGQHNIYFNQPVNDSVPEGIFKYIRKNKPDVIALIYHKESFLHRVVFKSEFKNILKSINIPILIIHG